MNGGREKVDRVQVRSMADYPRAARQKDCGLVGRAEILAMTTRPDDQSWFRHQIRYNRFPPADGQDIDGMPTWLRTTMLWHLMDRKSHTSGREYLTPERRREAEAAAAEFPDEFEAFRREETARRVGRRLAKKIVPGSKSRDPMTL